jgi:four helix bundle protein
LGKEIVVEVYKATKAFPPDEIYCLTNQMRRAALSIPSNIAEGFSRYHNKEYRQLLFIALGSCADLETQSEIAYELGYLDSSSYQSILEKLDHESRMLRNLIKKL